jgi:hypothetical protein
MATIVSKRGAAKRNPSPARGAGAVAPATYQGDYYSWVLQQAELLRSGNAGHADLENIAEELADLGRNEFHKLESAYRVLLLHMLKWDFQPQKRSRSWVNSIAAQRHRVTDILEDNPSLRSRTDLALRRAFRDARLEASTETGLEVEVFPGTLPYTLDEMMGREFSLS